MTVKQYKQKIATINETNYGPKSNDVLKAKCIQFELPLTITRHNKTCRGVIEHGTCTSCGGASEGQEDFYVAFDLEDLDDPDETFNMVGYRKLAISLFGPSITPEMLKSMPKSEVLDVLERWMERHQ